MTKEEFLLGVSNWSNHRHLLWDALQATNGDVIELGCGDGSTPFLSLYCKARGRMLYSYEGNLDWWGLMQTYNGEGHRVIFAKDWDQVSVNHPNPSVVLIDHSPGERRKIDIARFANQAQIIVAHDTEPAADHGYQMRDVLKTFKYMRDFKSEGAWASIASNFIPV